MNAAELASVVRAVVAEELARALAHQAEYLDTPAAASHLGLSRQRLETWRCTGGGPAFCKLGNAVRYRRADLDEFMASRRVRSTSEEVPSAE